MELAGLEPATSWVRYVQPMHWPTYPTGLEPAS